MGNDVRFRASVEAAREIEEAVAGWLGAQRGWLTLAVYDFSGLSENKAPKLRDGCGRALVLPDLLGAKAGASKFFEVKHKTQATWTHVTERWETGIDTRLWDDYCKVQDASGIPVWLMFVHEPVAGWPVRCDVCKSDRCHGRVVRLPADTREVRGHDLSTLRADLDKGKASVFSRPSPNFNSGRGGVMFAWDALVPVATLDQVMRFKRKAHAKLTARP